MLYHPNIWTIEKLFDQMIMIFVVTLILISYSYLGWYFFCHYYRQLKVLNMKSQIEFKTTWTLIIIFIFNAFVLGLPWLLDLLHYEGIYNNNIYLSLLFLSVCPYGLNVFMYLSILQYRKAYVFILKKALVKNNDQEIMDADFSSISFKFPFDKIISYFD